MSLAGPDTRVFDGIPAEMAERLGGTDWSATPLGPVSAWSPVLRMMVPTMLRSGFPDRDQLGSGTGRPLQRRLRRAAGAQAPAGGRASRQGHLAGGLGVRWPPRLEQVLRRRPDGPIRGRPADPGPQRVPGGVLLHVLAEPDHRRRRHASSACSRSPPRRRRRSCPSAGCGWSANSAGSRRGHRSGSPPARRAGHLRHRRDLPARPCGSWRRRESVPFAVAFLGARDGAAAARPRRSPHYGLVPGAP